MCFVDPPYFGKGPTLYRNTMDAAAHRALSERLRAMQDEPWILTYDDCPDVRAMYEPWARIERCSLRYTASVRRRGAEILIAPRSIRLPDEKEMAGLRYDSFR